jgi:hypothetical protein
MTYREAKEFNQLGNVDPDYALAIAELNEEFPAGQVGLDVVKYRGSTGLIGEHGQEILVGNIFEVNGEKFRDLGEAYAFAKGRGLNILRV